MHFVEVFNRIPFLLSLNNVVNPPHSLVNILDYQHIICMHLTQRNLIAQP